MLTLRVCVALVAGPTPSVQLTFTCWSSWPPVTSTYGVANATYDKSPGSDFVRIDAVVVSLVTVTGDVVATPTSGGGAEAQVGFPV